MDHRPQLERVARRALLTGALVIVGCALLGAAAAAEVAMHYTTPPVPKES
ncbi:hypothetical protein [Terrabacter sp. NPDC000476]